MSKKIKKMKTEDQKSTIDQLQKEWSSIKSEILDFSKNRPVFLSIKSIGITAEPKNKKIEVSFGQLEGKKASDEKIAKMRSKIMDIYKELKFNNEWITEYITREQGAAEPCLFMRQDGADFHRALTCEEFSGVECSPWITSAMEKAKSTSPYYRNMIFEVWMAFATLKFIYGEEREIPFGPFTGEHHHFIWFFSLLQFFFEGIQIKSKICYNPCILYKYSTEDNSLEIEKRIHELIKEYYDEDKKSAHMPLYFFED